MCSSYRRSLLLDPPYRSMHGRSRRVNRAQQRYTDDWLNPKARQFPICGAIAIDQQFYLLGETTKSRVTDWDPWPVKNFRPNTLFRAAEDIIKQRNEENLDNAVDKIVLLPASSTAAVIRMGTANNDICSIRSPSKLPMRIHLWQTSTGKIMVRKGIHSIPLVQFIRIFDVVDWSGPCKFYYFWKDLPWNDEVLNALAIPDHLKEAFHQRWWTINGFPFFDLPTELRDMVLKFAIGNIAEPYGHFPGSAVCKALLLTNRQLRREALPIMMSEISFVIRNRGQLMRFLEEIPKPTINALRSLDLFFEHEPLLDIFGAEVPLKSPALGYSLQDVLFRNGIKLRHLYIFFPHPYLFRSSETLDGACQKTVCSWIWAAARPYLRDIPVVEFGGFIKDSQKKEWLEILSHERRGNIPDRYEMREWQLRVWNTK